MLLRTAVSLATLAVATAQTSFRIVHINDFHANVEGLNAYASPCGSDPSVCDGTWARLFTQAKKFVSESSTDVLFLDDGDEFMGTIWSTYYKGAEAAIFLNELCDTNTSNVNRAGFVACVGTLGNHEFDYGYETVAEYVDTLTYPIVVANLEDECAENEAGTHAAQALGSNIEKYVVRTIEGVQVAITGYLTPETASISSMPSCVTLIQEETALDAVIADLATNYPDINIILSVGHSGYARDQQIAANVEELDLLVGGHSHTFLWGDAAGSEGPTLSGDATQTSLGAYPTMVGNTPVLQAYYAGVYLGAVDVDFDDSGVLLETTPLISLLGSAGEGSAAAEQYQVEPDPGIQALVAELAGPLDTYKNTVVGQTNIQLVGDRTVVRYKETNLGNFVCDSMLDNINTLSDFTESYGSVPLCVINGGGVRADISVGNVTVADVLAVLPFANSLAVINITGEELYYALESAVARVGEGQGEFPQVGSGMRVVFDKRIETECGQSTSKPDCYTTSGVPVKRVLEVYYNDTLIENSPDVFNLLVTNNYIAVGKDGYVAFGEADLLLEYGDVLASVLQDYIGLAPVTEERAKEECRLYDIVDPSAACQELLGATAAPTAGETFTPTMTPSSAGIQRAGIVFSAMMLMAAMMV